MSRTAKIWDKFADGYEKAPIRNEESYLKKMEITRSYFNEDMELFEFACGTGTTAIAHAPYVKHVTAIDISPRMLEIAKGKTEAAKIENVSFEQATIEEFNAPEKTYDAVMAHSILHLLQDPETAIAMAYKMLKPGGVFVTSTACLGDGIFFWKLILPLATLFRFAPFVNILSRKQLDEYFINCGFEIDFQWEQNKKEAAFIIAKRPLNEG